MQARMTGKEFIAVIKATGREFGKDDAGNMAAALTYYAFFSLFPLLILAITLAAVFVSSPADATRFIFDNMAQLLPGSGDTLSKALDVAFKSRNNAGILALVGVATLVFSATGAFEALDKAVNRAWKTEKTPDFITSKIISFFMMAGLALVLSVSFIITTALTTTRAITSDVLGEVPGSDIFWQTVTFAASVAIAFLGFLLIYRFLPRCDVLFKDVWLGALLAALVWSLLKEGFAYYLGSSFANYNAVYGTLGTVVAILTWIYLSSLIILAGAEFSAETARVRRLYAEVAAATEQEQTRGKNSPWLPGRET